MDTIDDYAQREPWQIRLVYLAGNAKTPEKIAKDIIVALVQLDKLRKIAAHIPPLVYLKAKEEAGYGESVKPNG